MNEKLSFGKVFVLGFALFTMFFGAGNLIFPPALGIDTGTNWLVSFLVYILADAGLAILALLAFFRCQEGFQNSISIQLDKTTSFLLILFNTLCIGPFIAIPRTAATTFDIAVKPLLGATVPGWASWAVGGIYFALVLILCLRPGKVVDIIGKVLSPTMFVALLVLIALGIIHPLGKVAPGASVMGAVKLGLESGYQTMDMLGSLLFAVVTLTSVRQAGINSPKKQFHLVALAGLVAAFALFVVYGGLTFLGASISGERGLAANALNDRAGLLVLIVRRLVGPWGTLLLGFIVTAACLTTSIGLASACSQNIEELTHGKLPYRPVLIAIILFSYVMSNLGTTAILNIAGPILNVIFPVFIMLVILSFLPRRINQETYSAPYGALCAFIVTVLTEIGGYVQPLKLLMARLPLASVGLGWLFPPCWRRPWARSWAHSCLGSIAPSTRKRNNILPLPCGGGIAVCQGS